MASVTTYHITWICSLFIVYELHLSVCQQRQQQTTPSYPEINTYKYGYDILSQYHNETKDGKGTVRGEYGHWSPDGWFRITNYTADKNGYRVIRRRLRGRQRPFSVHQSQKYDESSTKTSPATGAIPDTIVAGSAPKPVITNVSQRYTPKAPLPHIPGGVVGVTKPTVELPTTIGEISGVGFSGGDNAGTTDSNDDKNRDGVSGVIKENGDVHDVNEHESEKQGTKGISSIHVSQEDGETVEGSPGNVDTVKPDQVGGDVGGGGISVGTAGPGGDGSWSNGGDGRPSDIPRVTEGLNEKPEKDGAGGRPYGDETSRRTTPSHRGPYGRPVDASVSPGGYGSTPLIEGVSPGQYGGKPAIIDMGNGGRYDYTGADGRPKGTEGVYFRPGGVAERKPYEYGGLDNSNAGTRTPGISGYPAAHGQPTAIGVGYGEHGDRHGKIGAEGLPKETEGTSEGNRTGVYSRPGVKEVNEGLAPHNIPGVGDAGEPEKIGSPTLATSGQPALYEGGQPGVYGQDKQSNDAYKPAVATAETDVHRGGIPPLGIYPGAGDFDSSGSPSVQHSSGSDNLPTFPTYGRPSSVLIGRHDISSNIPNASNVGSTPRHSTAFQSYPGYRTRQALPTTRGDQAIYQAASTPPLTFGTSGFKPSRTEQSPIDVVPPDTFTGNDSEVNTYPGGQIDARNDANATATGKVLRPKQGYPPVQYSFSNNRQSQDSHGFSSGSRSTPRTWYPSAQPSIPSGQASGQSCTVVPGKLKLPDNLKPLGVSQESHETVEDKMVGKYTLTFPLGYVMEISYSAYQDPKLASHYLSHENQQVSCK